jgi:hypothetical protein
LARPGVRGTFSQPVPSRPAEAVRLARTLGRTAKPRSKPRALAQAHPPGLVRHSPRLPTCQRLAFAAHSAARALCARSKPALRQFLRRRTWCERACMTSAAAQNPAFIKPVPQGAPCAHRVCSCSPPLPAPRSLALPGYPCFRPQHQFVAFQVRPNPSLSRDPTRQGAWASCHLRLCCATPPKRLAVRVAVSSNVRPRKPNAKTATPSRFAVRSVIEQLQQRSLSGIAQSCKEARKPPHAPDRPLRSEERPGGSNNQQPQTSTKHRRPSHQGIGAREREHEHELAHVLQAFTTRAQGSERTSSRLPAVAIRERARHLCSTSREA